MRIDVSLGALAPDEKRLASVHDRVRWSLGGHSAEVHRIHVAFRPTEDGTECTVRVHLRGSRKHFELSCIGRDFDTALRFATARAGATVVRRFKTDPWRGR